MRLMTTQDVGLGLELCKLAGWNQTADDWLNLILCAPDGCFVAEWEGKPAGTVTTTSYGTDVAWIGMMLVHPAQRRQGIGKALMNRALEHLRSQPVCCIKLDATPAGQPLYEKLGFKPEWTFQRWQHAKLATVECNPRFKVRRWLAADFTSLQQLDRLAFGAGRFVLLRRMLDLVSREVVGASAAGRVNSYGFVRKGRLALYLGPIVGESLPAAAPVIKSLLAPLEGRAVFWDIPDAQTGAIELAKSFGFEPVRQLTRMCLGKNHCPGDPRMIFAIAGPEVG
jgi:RimJ/RimL family protein N-acetyltransferase